MAGRMLRFVVLALSLSLSGLTACAGPCEQLANVICNCEEDAVQRQACINQVTADVGRIKFADSDNKYCEAKLKTCDKNCAALRAGNRAACGFIDETK